MPQAKVEEMWKSNALPFKKIELTKSSVRKFKSDTGYFQSDARKTVSFSEQISFQKVIDADRAVNTVK